jgi:2,3-bisphosphoglycerate-independent phosphoglycerate mutase
MSAHRRPLVLAILDGWGYRAQREANAIAQARKPVYDKLLAEFPNTLLHASDHFVGLPDGQMGNSEVGHLNIGAGRVVEMDMTRIDTLVATDTLGREPAVAAAMEHAGQHARALHLLGLLSDGGVHSHQQHLYALLRAARAILRACSPSCGSMELAGLQRSLAATMRWTGTCAGSGRRRLSMQW